MINVGDNALTQKKGIGVGKGIRLEKRCGDDLPASKRMTLFSLRIPPIRADFFEIPSASSVLHPTRLHLDLPAAFRRVG